MDDEVDPDIDELLGDLEGSARAERAELIEWLFEQGITAEEIQGTSASLLLATRRVIGDDGTYVSTREIADAYGIDLDLLQRVQRAIGLARIDDPDAAVHMRADGEAAGKIASQTWQSDLQDRLASLTVVCYPSRPCRENHSMPASPTS